MFCSPLSLSDQKLIDKISLVDKTLRDSERDLTRQSPNLSYTQIQERVSDLNRLRNFKRSLENEKINRGLHKEKPKEKA